MGTGAGGERGGGLSRGSETNPELLQLVPTTVSRSTSNGRDVTVGPGKDQRSAVT